jgi:hypothetical protein
VEPIDRPFRLTWDFCIVWVLLEIPTLLLISTGHWEADQPWYSKCAFLIVIPFIVTFILYGPIMFTRQIICSGSRGRFVLRVYLSIVLMATLFFGGLFIFGHHKNISERCVFAATAAAILYLHCRIDEK